MSNRINKRSSNKVWAKIDILTIFTTYCPDVFSSRLKPLVLYVYSFIYKLFFCTTIKKTLYKYFSIKQIEIGGISIYSHGQFLTSRNTKHQKFKYKYCFLRLKFYFKYFFMLKNLCSLFLHGKIKCLIYLKVFFASCNLNLTFCKLII